MTTKSEAYWKWYRTEGAQLAAKAARSAVDAMPDLSAFAREVARDLSRDQGHKQRIFARSPGVFSGVDAQELGQASSRELAARELKELGIEVGDCDPVQLLDAHHRVVCTSGSVPPAAPPGWTPRSPRSSISS
jgi:hypothetical protein